jgi:NAD(P)-dependent dehydrogenase (short-subunit alcohol dehydrogenase family)
LADAFLAHGCTVTVCGRSGSDVDATVKELGAAHADSAVAGVQCDVQELTDVVALWDTAAARFGGVDIWINNAGVTHEHRPTWEIPPGDVTTVVGTNLLGTLHGVHVAIPRMLAQGRGQVWNMEGAGSDGNARPGTVVYAATKSAVRTVTRTLMAEVKDTPVQVGILSPGMVVTRLLIPDPDAINEHARQAFNVLADTVETVAPWLVDQVLATEESGAEIRWLTEEKIAERMRDPAYQTRKLV